MAQPKVKQVYNRYTGAHVQVSEEVWAGMNSADYAPSTDASREAAREAGRTGKPFVVPAAKASTPSK